MLALELIRGYTFQDGEKIDAAKLNQLGAPAVNLIGTLGSTTIGAGAVGTAQLATNAVTTVKITDLNVTTGKIADGAITTIKLADDAVTPAKLDPAAQFAINGASRGLLVNYVSGASARIRADEIILKTSGGDCVILGSVDETVAITTAGAGGLDTGTEAASTWYYLWLIYNPGTVDVAGLISASSSSPTLPSGYTYRALVGVVGNNASSNFIEFYQRGNRVHAIWDFAFSDTTLTATWDSFVLKAVRVTGSLPQVPPIATAIRGVMGLSTYGGSQKCTVGLAATSTQVGVQLLVLGDALGVGPGQEVFYASAPFELMLPEYSSGDAGWTLYRQAATGSLAHYTLMVTGYDL
jgi:hypothetical protein